MHFCVLIVLYYTTYLFPHGVDVGIIISTLVMIHPDTPDYYPCPSPLLSTFCSDNIRSELF